MISSIHYIAIRKNGELYVHDGTKLAQQYFKDNYHDIKEKFEAKERSVKEADNLVFAYEQKDEFEYLIIATNYVSNDELFKIFDELEARISKSCENTENEEKRKKDLALYIGDLQDMFQEEEQYEEENYEEEENYQEEEKAFKKRKYITVFVLLSVAVAISAAVIVFIKQRL